MAEEPKLVGDEVSRCTTAIRSRLERLYDAHSRGNLQGAMQIGVEIELIAADMHHLIEAQAQAQAGYDVYARRALLSCKNPELYTPATPAQLVTQLDERVREAIPVKATLVYDDRTEVVEGKFECTVRHLETVILPGGERGI